jgi:hypothetical protein
VQRLAHFALFSSGRTSAFMHVAARLKEASEKGGCRCRVPQSTCGGSTNESTFVLSIAVGPLRLRLGCTFQRFAGTHPRTSNSASIPHDEWKHSTPSVCQYPQKSLPAAVVDRAPQLDAGRGHARASNHLCQLVCSVTLIVPHNHRQLEELACETLCTIPYNFSEASGFNSM